MDFQAEAMAGSVEESLHAPVLLAGLVAFFGKKIGDLLVNLLARDFVANVLESNVLTLLDRVVQFAQRFVGTALYDGPGDVAKIPRFLRARENIQNDRFIGPKKAKAAFVRIARLPASGDNRICREPAGLNNRRVDNSAQL